MKTLGVKMMTGCFLVASVIVSSFGQAPMKSIAEGGKKPTKIDKALVPTVITEKYYVEYPIVVNEGWYGYPAFADESDWYGYDPNLTTSTSPEYYIVEFEKEETLHKVIYAKGGKKIATHRAFKTDLPKAVTVAIGNSKYKTWTLIKEKEEMFRDADKMKVYKIVVEKGTEKHALYFQQDGKLLKDRTIKA